MYRSKHSPQVSLNWLESIACRIVKCDYIPQHIAFIMDGNRRFAQKSGLGKADGHRQGLNTLTRVLSWCREFGITQVTLYAFSVENFKRTPDEVNSIMDLARQKCDTLLDEMDQVNEAGIRVRIVGDLHLLPDDLRDKIERIQSLTRNNDRAFLNICLAYTSRHELVHAIKRLSKLVREERSVTSEDVDLNLLEDNLYLKKPFPELIIRTSGEVRLSDFMLWQCQASTLMFVDALWPEISFWDFLKVIFHYQYQRKFQ